MFSWGKSGWFDKGGEIPRFLNFLMGLAGSAFN
jgi:hypothetical protein